MEKFKAPALAKGLDIIDLIREKGSMSFNEIQEKTYDNPASLSRYLQTLIAKKYIYKNSSQKYELGLKLIELSHNESLWSKLLTDCRPLMMKVNECHNVTLLLIAYTNQNCMAIEKIIAPDNLGMMSKNSTFTNGINNIWSNKFYSINIENNIDVYKKSILKDEKGLLKSEDIKDFISNIKNKGYMIYTNRGKAIIRMGFPIYYKGYVIATIGLGTFVDQIEEEEIDIIKNTILDGIQYIQKSLESSL